ncbi:MAG TPA: twin-arginine translocase TatA/TatE family subunit [Acidobacteriota bacterium]|jgi:TatA/E family protein of Tat protein translocase|nr:twin-arginine translocase TatA/TatE family subunit [Acidobacteriota bacterium]
MFGSLGFSEIVVIFLIALIIFGPRKLPELGKSLGRGLSEFKKATNDLKRTWEDEVRAEDEKLRQLTSSVPDTHSSATPDSQHSSTQDMHYSSHPDEHHPDADLNS